MNEEVEWENSVKMIKKAGDGIVTSPKTSAQEAREGIVRSYVPLGEERYRPSCRSCLLFVSSEPVLVRCVSSWVNS